ncbi:DUF2334 domain-containing protein [Clostridium sp. OS1-26]|uniref:DUF2334 domain-containing protein n=1 Tax=Clostridium sp. OS1-26 TaxID=3070681 RepID=UPI0027E1D8CF|nr:DUF2334 domain-containing protein [Clostridium sp. OS1-26]WML35990.1 DUF2334 domain-containing protein [Clostridium sp. OS1-26]
MKGFNKWKFLIIIIILLVFTYFIKSASSKVATENNSNKYTSKDINMIKANISLRYEDVDLSLSSPIYVENNRYYIPATEILGKLHGKVSIKDNSTVLMLNQCNIIVNYDKDEFVKNERVIKLKEKPIYTNDCVYITMFDFIRMFNLKTQWNIDKNTISLYKNRDIENFAAVSKKGKPALIRLEDIAAGGRYSSEESLEKLRIVCDYLNSEGIPFHIAWIPRYINPSKNIDNNLLKDYSMYNADFIFTLDYFIDKGGIVGLHGYTHQYGETESVEGIEFHRSLGDNVPGDIQYAQERINAAIDVASQLKIQYNFFEVPHYAILYPQQNIIEKNFEYIYEPYSKDGGITEYNKVFCKHEYGKTTKYIPTPLNYINGKDDCINMLKKIDKLKDGLIASFFYHPYIEFDDIKISQGEDGYSYYEYSNQSVLHQVIDRLKYRNFTFYRINDVK